MAPFSTFSLPGRHEVRIKHSSPLAPTTGRDLFLALSIAFVLLLGGCADYDMIAGSQCGYDSDCPKEEYCLNLQCAARCSHDDECPSGTYCQAYQRSDGANPVQACIDSDSHPNGGVDCEDDAQCQSALDDPQARCSMHGRCMLSSGDTESGETENSESNGEPQNQGSNNDDSEPTPRRVVKIEQLDAEGLPVSPDDLPPEEDEDSEASPQPVHIGAVLVRDDQHTAIGYGTLLYLESADDEREDELASAPVPLDEDGICVETPAEAPFASLGGPGGRVWIDLVDGENNPLELDHQWYLQIVANGPKCPLGAGDEALGTDDDDRLWGQYRVHLCDSDSTASQPDIAELHCHQILGDELSHFSELEVTTDP